MKKLLILLVICLSSTMMFAQTIPAHYVPVTTGQDLAGQNLSLTGYLAIDHVYQDNEFLEIGVFDQDGVCRAAKVAKWYPKGQKYIFQLVIKGNEGFVYDCKVYDHESEQETQLVLDIDTVLTWSAGGKIGSLGDLYEINFTNPGGPVVEDVDQVFNLSAGWNWISAYVEAGTDNALLADLQAGILANNSSAMIKDMINSTMIQNGEWSDSDLEFLNEKMYMANLTNATTVTITAAPADPAQHQITIVPGWNWIGFISSEIMTVEQALAGLTPNNGDMIKNMSGAMSFTSGSWQGNMDNMLPGSGYMYNNKGAQMTLTYPASAKGVVRSIPVEKYWSTNVHEHATNLVMMATLDEGQFRMGEGNYEIGAFVGDECRGSARLQKTTNGYVAFLVIHGDSGEEISFKLYDVMNAMEAGSSEEQIRYVANAITGSVEEPMVLHFRSTGVNEDANSLSVFPNPTKDNVMIQGEAIETVSVYNTLGQCMLNETFENAKSVELNMSNLSAGVYMVSIRTNGTMVTTMIVKE